MEANNARLAPLLASSAEPPPGPWDHLSWPNIGTENRLGVSVLKEGRPLPYDRPLEDARVCVWEKKTHGLFSVEHGKHLSVASRVWVRIIFPCYCSFFPFFFILI
jgi:hypothetical protein